jgi:hypothetical protein
VGGQSLSRQSGRGRPYSGYRVLGVGEGSKALKIPLYSCPNLITFQIKTFKEIKEQKASQEAERNKTYEHQVGCRIGGMMVRPVRRGVPKGVSDGRRSPALRAGHPRNGHKAVSGMAHPQPVEGLGMAGPGQTLGSPWIPLAIRA